MRFDIALALTWLLSAVYSPALEEESALRWEDTVRKFEAQDREQPPPQGEILFLGSSSIRKWDLAKSFPDETVLNRGFGGSQTSDCLYFFSRLVIPYAPRVIVFYEGDNDIAKGKSPKAVFSDYQAFVTRVHEKLPRTRVVFISIKPSIRRWKLIESIREANTRIRGFSAQDPRLVYVDIDAPMLGQGGQPKPSLFIGDGLHLSESGYELWSSLVKPHLRTQKQLLLASCQFPVSGDIRKNAESIRQQVTEAARRGAELVHFSEAALSGYPRVDYDPAKRQRDWDLHTTELETILELAKQHQVWLVLGADHRLSEGNLPHNSLYVIAPNGKIVDRYDKRFCTRGDLRHYSPGDHFTAFDVNGVRCGLLVCYDVRFPELYRKYHLDDVRLMLHSFHNARQKPDAVHGIIMPASLQTRAATNNMFVSATNSCAPESWPGLLATPDGRIAARLPKNKPGIVVSLIDADRKYYDASAPYRRQAINGTLNSGETVDDPRSKKRQGG